MDDLLEFFEQVANKEITPKEALAKYQNKDQKIDEIDCANIDLDRAKRTGYPEVIYGASKTVEQIVSIAKAMKEKDHPVFITRVDSNKAKQIILKLPDLKYHETAQIITWIKVPITQIGDIAIVTAGTSDIKVAEEAALTAEFFGNKVTRIYDVGVAGIQRLFNKLELIRKSNVVVVIAGMEGALVSVVGGLVNKPLIAVPTSVGYGSHLNGLTPLLAMLNSCAPGVSVVNIDNGFGAGYDASMINKLAERGNL